MFSALKVGDRIRLSSGYEMEPKWLAGHEYYLGTLVEFIPNQDQTPEAIVKLDNAITFDGITGNVVVLKLRYVGAKWKEHETVHIELCSSAPEVASWKTQQQGKWIESHATYTKL